MKNKFLMMMFFFAFMILGVQNMNAQYVQPGQAMNLLQNELQTVESNPIYNGSQENHPQFEYFSTKYDFYMMVYEQLLIGDQVANAIQVGIDEVPRVYSDSQMVGVVADQGDLPPLHQEIVDLLEN